MRAQRGGLIAWVAGVAALLGACSSSTLDVGRHPDTTITPTTASGVLFGTRVTAWSTLAADGSVLEVGVRLPMAAVDAASATPTEDPELTLAMPSRVSETTFFDHLDIYWASTGHAPNYENAHFDLHFFRLSVGDVAAIDCSDRTPVPVALLPPGYSELGVSPECRPQVGFHASPDTDLTAVPFTKTINYGYYGGKTTFVEPMVVSDKLRLRQSFSIPMSVPTSLGGARTRFPTKFDARYDDAGAAYDLVFSAFVTID